MTLQIDERTKTAILKTLDTLPPLAWIDHCETVDQVKHWLFIRVGFQGIHKGLEEFFQGKGSTIESPITKALMDYYLALYAVIQRGWKYIKEAAINCKSKFPNTPGEALIALIQNDCAALFTRCLQCHEYSRDTTYRFFLKERKLEPLLQDLASGLPLSHSEINQVKEFVKKLKTLQRTSAEFLEPRHFTLYVCRQAAKQDASLKAKLKAFDQVSLDLHSQLIPITKDSESYRWDGDGNRREGTRPGGIYT